jgi:hypothetical protein
MENYAGQIKTLYESGGTLKETQGTFSDVLKSATGTYHSVIEQADRARVTAKRFEIQEKMAAGTATGDEKAMYARLKEFRPQDVTEVEANIARRVMQHTEKLLAPIQQTGFAGSTYEMAAIVGARGVGGSREAEMLRKQQLRLTKSDRGMGDLIGRQVSLSAGRFDRSGFEPGAMATAGEISGLAQERRAIYEQFAPMKTQYDRAKAEGRMGEAKQLHQQMQPLLANLNELRDNIGMLTPQVKEHIETLQHQTKSIEKRASEDEKIYSQLRQRYDTLATQREATKDKFGRMRISSEMGDVSNQMTEYNQRIMASRRQIGAGEAEVGALRGLMGTPGGGTPRALGAQPQTRMDRLGGFLGKQLNPQRLFYESQALAQGYYMLGMPLAQARESYLGSEISRGRMEFALGLGGVGPEVAQVQRQRAIMGDFGVGVGQGVNRAVSPWINRIGSAMEANEGFAPAIGQVGTYGLAAGVAGFAANKFGLLGLAGGGITGGLAAAGGGFGAGVGALALGAPLLAGAGTIGVYEAARQKGWLGETYKDQSAMDTFGMYGNFAGMLLDAGTSPFTGRSWEQIGKTWGGAPPGQAGSDQGLSEIEQVLNARERPMAEEIKGMRKDFKDALGGRVTTDQAGEIITQYSEATGASAEDLLKGPSRQNLLKLSKIALDAGMEPEQLVNYIGQAPRAFGLGAGSGQTDRILQMFTGAKSLTDIESMLQAGQQVSASVQATGLFENIENITQQYRDLAKESQYQAQRYQSKITLANQYDYSEVAYEAGAPELTLFDQQEPWRPKYERETREIEDRRRKEDQTRGFQYGQEDIDFAVRRYELEEEFWDFRMDKREQDYRFQIRQHDLTIKQMEYNMNRQDEYAKLQQEHSRKNFEISLKLFDLQTKYTEQDFVKKEQRLDLGFGRQMQDFGLAREDFELQAGWQSEDFERALKYSTGRQRLDVKREMGRSGILANRKRSRMALQEGRALEDYDLAKEDLATDIERFQETRPLQREQMVGGFEYQQQMTQLQEEDRAKQREFAAEQIQLQKDRHAAWLEDYERETPLLEERHQLELEMAVNGLNRQRDTLELAKQRAAEDEIILGWQREIQKAQQLYNATAQLGLETTKEWTKELAQVAEHLKTITADADISDEDIEDYVPGSSGSGSRTRSPRKKGSGGYTERPTYAMLSERSQPEYVVPQHGALVLRESMQPTNDRSVALLETIAKALDSGGKIVIDAEALRDSGFVHVADFKSAYH